MMKILLTLSLLFFFQVSAWCQDKYTAPKHSWKPINHKVHTAKQESWSEESFRIENKAAPNRGLASEKKKEVKRGPSSHSTPQKQPEKTSLKPWQYQE